MVKICKKHIINKLKNSKGLFFHIVGILSLIWITIRVLPAPHRSQYPCQQLAIPIGFGYIAFWSVIFSGIILWMKKIQKKSLAIAPCLLMISILLFSIAGFGFANPSSQNVSYNLWDPIPKQPIGTPQGYKPGRVTWVWDNRSTEQYPTGYWWEKQNNDQEIIDNMITEGIKSLGNNQNEEIAWDNIFKYFNQKQGNGNIGYQTGEKIAIKINMNNGFYNNYNWESDDVDANPYVVKALLRKLINVVGVNQEDITVYDASRKLFDWFYNRVYYEEYPSNPLIVEFPNVHFVDLNGGPGREQVIASSERVYFADGPCQYRTLPTVVSEAKYMINMPIAKRHIGDRVTLAGKNWFGTWMEDVGSIHTYHTTGYSAMGNPAPQVDLLAHEHLGKKTFLLIGDGTYGSRYGLADCTHFEMYPFNGDWMSSLFFSQDGIALDSVLYDFFYVEGTNGGPSEGAQNYIHQGAEPPIDLYDPENDGIYISESLGVHEHWDTSIDIFSPDRYSGASGNGIDYIPIFYENQPPNTPINPIPNNNAIDIDPNTNLKWSCIDPDEDSLTYDVFLGTNSTPSLVSSNQSGTTYNPDTLDVSTKYYWKIIAYDNYDHFTEGPIWEFTTSDHINNPPIPPNNPYPENNSINIPIDINLSWNCTDPDEGDTIYYDIYFEESDSTPDVLISENQSEIFLNIDSLNFGQIYYWNVIAYDSLGATTSSPIWKFTTEVEINNPPNKPTINGPNSGEKEIKYDYTVSSIDPEGNELKYFFDWGDGSVSGWLGPYNSSEECIQSHIWNKTGTYEIMVKAIDIYNAESEWSTLTVSMAKNKPFLIFNNFIEYIKFHYPLIYNYINKLILN